MFNNEQDFTVINKVDECINKMEDKASDERTFAISDYQGEPHRLGLKATPIYAKVSNLVQGEDHGILISNGNYVLFVDEVGKSGFTKLYLYASGNYESIPANELSKPFFKLC